jgi:hypothetical protein
MRPSRKSPPPRKINESYVSRVLRLTLLVPDIVEIDPGRAAVGGPDACGVGEAVSR